MTHLDDRDTHVSISRPGHWLALATILMPITGFAQSLDAPGSVCIGEDVRVEWDGPNDAGDLITISWPTSAADEWLSAGPTSAGNPVVLNAPTAEGYFDLRYVQPGPGSILVRRGISVRACGSAGSEREAGSNMAVVVAGVQANYGDVIQQQPPFGNFDGRAEALCGASDTVGWALNTIVGLIAQGMEESGSPITFDMIEQLPDAPSRDSIARNMRAARDAFCAGDQPPQIQPFAITYAYCRMAMVTPYQVMDIHLPPQVGTGRMTAADYREGEAMQVTIRRSFDASASVLGAGWSQQVEMTNAVSGGRRIGYSTMRYDFNYSGGLGGEGAVPFASMVDVQNNGQVWVSDDVPGLDIVETFYRNLTSEISPDLEGMSFFAGMLKNLVGMLQHGLPLEVDQTIESSAMGMMSVSGRSHSVVTDVSLVEFRPEWCSESLLPPNMPVRDIDQEISEAMGRSGAGSAEMAEAMQEYQRAMEQMTPEERQMMEQFGLGSMMEQMTGGAGASPAQASPSVSGGRSSGAGSNMPTSSELQGENLTESVQRHLQALGYDVGVVNGEASLETTIAISTFQAEKGMDVTGEVTPQLLGALAAEVDSQR